MKITLTSNELEISDITQINSFNDKEFILEIDNTGYIIKGDNLILKEVYNNNTSIKILGNIFLIEKKNHKENKDKKNFVKKLFS